MSLSQPSGAGGEDQLPSSASGRHSEGYQRDSAYWSGVEDNKDEGFSWCRYSCWLDRLVLVVMLVVSLSQPSGAGARDERDPKTNTN